MHVQLPLTDVVQLMGSDVVEGLSPPVPFGTNFDVMLVAQDKAEADRVFAMLAEGGEVTMPIGNAPWGSYFGMSHDRFDLPWMISLDHPA
jgi:PhnB protein